MVRSNAWRYEVSGHAATCISPVMRTREEMQQELEQRFRKPVKRLEPLGAKR
jgi:hypothetical protein